MNFINLQAQYLAYKDEIDEQIQSVLSSSSFIGGEKLQELEQNLAHFANIKHAITCSSGTSALYLALRALDIGKDDEVIVPSFTFIATAEMVSLVGAKPVFIDIDLSNYNLDFNAVKKAISPKTKAVIAVSMFGQMSDLRMLNNILKEKNIALIEDGAQSFGASFKQEKSCSIAKISCTSFFPSKPLGAYGDGGAVFCHDDELAKKIKILLNHGQTQRYKHELIGINARLDTLQAAILNVKLKHFQEELNQRQKLAQIYDTNLKNCQIPKIHPNAFSTYAQYSILVEDRPSILKKFEKANIPYAIHYPTPLHKQPCFSTFSNLELKNAQYASDHILSLPFSPFLSQKEQDQVIAVFKD
ncbi:DegT/DnrJ/EryC1/StrS aminotransferase family protein [Campylobacter hepaticus]|uniref:Aminotransferase class I/II-fold pyridoxal phosphate-dependent enzyme n=1 Tax=Campylobacter hepaticus TaxID=1813019 RepID=A0A6A7JT98_9BACT|nr:DegT/DnrJ/EryC1/StrS aminotransferase family protein [Campylobacter hepaticus]AXP08976.1 DegT/DnrJ/EryC1/StrS aminotransferase family protein [Campylobacter hepaticus]MCZ0771984.1 DegT/DnrJ/EryC1/StrS aminotransferase family protein [Campylobacter hepaticus]MCZ0773453.1 DegT/DnrJ/EryC1/StrS aminotransferase family protein [Campylobacter hepaticus]MCZ0774703.1 DegT/DnrJ/EryC1/StrS aminotransferase family protein [Campylobacter hepaticus]MDX2323779.1 DegT/DnrJ/EryC1/StrS aminotransferase fami